jgi:polysaccharide pyruvyl transferase WcaK-like protein
MHYDGNRISTRIAKKLKIFKAGLLAGGTLIGQGQYWLEVAQTFTNLCQKLYIFGTGVETASFWNAEATHDAWKKVLAKCKYVGVRGPISSEILSNYGLNNVEIVGDPILTFAHSTINESPIFKTIGLNIGTTDNRLYGDEEKVCVQAAKLAKLAREAGWSVKWFVVWPKDIEITRKAALLSDTEKELNLIYDDYHGFIDKMRTLSCFVGMKLHATALATCAMTPSVMLEYRPKCRDFMESIGQGKYNFRTDEFRAEEIWEILLSWNNKRNSVAKALLESIRPVQIHQKMRAEQLASNL